MRMSDLSRSSGVSVTTIKYYLREGLLPPGRQLSGPRPSTTRTTCAGCG
jgi:DNA-binding transcriptional MerR regulator